MGNEKLYLRRTEARQLLGLSEQMFTKLIRAGVLTPKCFAGGTRAFFERMEVEGVKPKAWETPNSKR